MNPLLFQLEQRLTAIFAQRRGHRTMLGLDTRRVPSGTKLLWRDALTRTEGSLCICPERELPELVGRALELIATLRQSKPALPKAFLLNRELDKRAEEVWKRKAVA